MSEEEKKDLEYIKESPTSREIMLLRIISKLQADIGRLEKKNKRYEKYLKNKDEEHEKVLEFIETEKEKLQSDIEIKDKVIDYAMEEIHSIVNLGEFIDRNIDNLDTKEEIKQYFYEQVEKLGGEDE